MAQEQASSGATRHAPGGFLLLAARSGAPGRLLPVTGGQVLGNLVLVVAAELLAASVSYQEDELRAYLGALWGRAKLDPEPRSWARRYAA